MARTDLKNMSFSEIIELRNEIETYLKTRAMEEIQAKEKELNDLREMAGMRRKPPSGITRKPRKPKE